MHKLMDTKIATLAGVREHTEGIPVELWIVRIGASGGGALGMSVVTIIRMWICQTFWIG